MSSTDKLQAAAIGTALILAASALVGNWWQSQRDADRQTRIAEQVEARLLTCISREVRR